MKIIAHYVSRMIYSGGTQIYLRDPAGGKKRPREYY